MKPQIVRGGVLKYRAHQYKLKEGVTFSAALDEVARHYGHENYQAYRDFMKREAPHLLDMLKDREGDSNEK